MFIGENTNVLGAINLDDVVAEDVHIDDPVEASMYVAAVSEANFNAIMKPMAYAEHQALMSGHSPVEAYTEGVLSSFWEKVKEWAKKLWAKIKAIWAKIMTRIDGITKNGQEFWNKYKTTLSKKFATIDKDKIKFKGYNFTIPDIPSNIEAEIKGDMSFIKNDDFLKVKDAVEKAAKMDSDAVDDILDKLRGELAGASSTGANEFSKELFDKFRDGGTKDPDLGKVDFGYLSRVLDKSDKTISDAKKAANAISKYFEKIIRICEKGTKEAVDANIEANKNGTEDTKKFSADAVTACHVWLRLTRGFASIMQVYCTAVIKAKTDEISQAKGFAGQVLRASNKSGYGESASMGIGSDIFANVKLA